MFYKFDQMAQNRREVPPGAPGCLRRLACFGDSLSAMCVDFEKGFSFPPHAHEHEQLTIILSGKIRYTIGDETMIMEAGDTAYLPSNVLHTAVALEDTRFIDVFTPVRMDQMAFFDKSIPYVPAFTTGTN